MKSRIIASAALLTIFSFHASSSCKTDLEQFLFSSHKAKAYRNCSEIQALYQNINAETIVGAMKINPYVWFNLMWWDAYSPEKDDTLSLKLNEIAQKYPDVVQQMFTDYIEYERIDPNILEAFQKFNAHPNEKAKTSAYTPFEILEARYSANSKKVIPGIKCKNCDTWASSFAWFFRWGYDQECTTMKKGITLLKKESSS